MTRRLLTVRQVAEITGISSGTLYYWRSRSRGEGPPSIKLGNLVRFDADQLEAWIEKCESADLRSVGVIDRNDTSRRGNPGASHAEAASHKAVVPAHGSE